MELKQLYRTAVAEDHPDDLVVNLGDRQIRYRKVTWEDGDRAVGLRYGENPHQPAAYYVPVEGMSVMGSLEWLKLGKGGPSWTNLADMDHALRILRYLDRPAAAVMKHLNPAGVAQQAHAEPLREVYRAARGCDERASFGGVVALNREVDAETAKELASTFIEAVVAPDFTDEALGILSQKKDLRVARVTGLEQLPRYAGDRAGFDLKVLSDGSLLMQAPYLTRIRSWEDFVVHPVAGAGTDRVCGERQPTPGEFSDLLLAWYVAAGVRSNAVVFVKAGRTLAIGTGEQERIGAIEQAIAKARAKGHDLRDAVVASDGFFPFRDAVDTLAEAGVRCVVQPGGSVRDGEVLEACNEHRMAMVFTGERCFGHF